MQVETRTVHLGDPVLIINDVEADVVSQCVSGLNVCGDTTALVLATSGGGGCVVHIRRHTLLVAASSLLQVNKRLKLRS